MKRLLSIKKWVHKICQRWSTTTEEERPKNFLFLKENERSRSVADWFIVRSSRCYYFLKTWLVIQYVISAGWMKQEIFSVHYQRLQIFDVSFSCALLFLLYSYFWHHDTHFSQNSHVIFETFFSGAEEGGWGQEAHKQEKPVNVPCCRTAAHTSFETFALLL